MWKPTPSRFPKGAAGEVPTIQVNPLTYTHSRGGKVLTTRQFPVTSDTTSTDFPGTSWPILLAPFKLAAKPGDHGLGDIIARVVGPIGGDVFKAWYQKTFGHSCGCNDRQAALNRRFPLPTPKIQP